MEYCKMVWLAAGTAVIFSLCLFPSDGFGGAKHKRYKTTEKIVSPDKALTAGITKVKDTQYGESEFKIEFYTKTGKRSEWV